MKEEWSNGPNLSTVEFSEKSDKYATRSTNESTWYESSVHSLQELLPSKVDFHPNNIIEKTGIDRVKL